MLNKTSKIISLVFEPKITFFILYIYISWFVYRSLILFAVIFVFSTLSILLLTLSESKIKEEDHYTFTNKLHRTVRFHTYILTLASATIFILYALYFNKSIVFFLNLSLITVLLLFTATKLKIKISAHITYTGLLILFFFLQSPAKYILFILCSLLIGTARINLKKHNILQIIIAVTIILINYISIDLLNVQNIW